MSLSIGLESINEDSLDSIRKGFNQPTRFDRDLAAIRAKGIQVIALLMVGLDGDTLDTFQRSLRLPDRQQGLVPEAVHARARIPARSTTTTCSPPDRITVHDWGRYDYGSPLIRPASMTAGRDDGRLQVRLRRLLLRRAIAKRLFPPPAGSYLETLAYLVANLKVNRFLRSHENAWATIS